MSEFGDKLREEVQRIIDEPSPELPPSEPVRIETEGVFDAELTDDPDSLLDNPMKLFASLVGDLKDMANRPPLGILAELPPAEHKVKIFRMDDRTRLADVADQIEILLNDGWCCHHPTVCNDFLIMDFSRRKETEEDERRDSANEAHEIQPGH